MRNPVALILDMDDPDQTGSKHPFAEWEVLFKPMVKWVEDACRESGIEKITILPEDGGLEFARENIDTDILVISPNMPLISADELVKSGLRHNNEKRDITFITSGQKGEGSGATWFRGEILLEALKKLRMQGEVLDSCPTDTENSVNLMEKTATVYKVPDKYLAFSVMNKADLLEINMVANKIVIDRLLQKGVNFYCTDGIVISPDAVIGKDTTIAPGTLIKGRVTIGEDCVIGPNTTIVDSIVEDGCHLISSLIESAVVGRGSRVGPNSHLRPDSVLAAGVKIGNFVEIKNSSIGESTSVAHLTYIGDTDMGAHVNVGCGVVTVNYNGHKKFRSTVGDNAFIGCNTNLVSPVVVKAGAYTAAGSTITADVPENALAIARARQENKPGWALSYKEKNGK